MGLPLSSVIFPDILKGASSKNAQAVKDANSSRVINIFLFMVIKFLP
jgi:hypothetical protein